MNDTPAVLSKPKIVLCLEYSIFAFGGTEVLVRELIRQLSSRFRIALVSNDKSIVGTWVEALLEQHIPWIPGTTEPENLIQALEDSNADLIHFHLGDNYCWKIRNPWVCPVTLAGESGLKVLTTNHGFFSPIEGYCAQYRPKWLKLILFPMAWLAKMRQLAVTKAEIAVSRYDHDGLSRWYRPHRSRIRWIYHSQLPLETPPVSRDSRRKVILCVGTIGPRKGQPDLVEAFARIANHHRDWSLELAGRPCDSDMMGRIASISRNHGVEDRVLHSEGLSDETITEKLKSSEVFAMPSLFEGLGLSLQEALYYGCACVSTESGGPADLIDDGTNGLLVPKNDISALSAALDRLLSDPDLRAKFRAAGPISIRRKQMSGPEMADRYSELYENLLSHHGR